MAENPIWLARPPEAAPPGRRLAVKDLFDTADLPTTYGSPIFAGHRPARDAWSVALLREAGWEVAGKTNLHEFAYGTTSRNPHFGTVRNPLDETRLAGGSSGGSAAAVAAGEADAALGTDSGGSIRIPAACCGIAGFKPTYGLVSTDGVYPLAPSFDHVGPIAADAAACAAVMEDLVPGLDVPDADPGALRCGVVWTERTSPGVAAGVEAVAARFGTRADPEFAPPGAFARSGFFPYEAALLHRRLMAERRADYGADVLLKLEVGRDTPHATYVEGRRAVARLRRDLAPAFGAVDVLLAPTLPSVAPLLDATDIGGVPVNDALASLTFPFNALGWPVAALATTAAEHGLPGSVQVIGPPGADAFVLAVAIAIERAV